MKEKITTVRLSEKDYNYITRNCGGLTNFIDKMLLILKLIKVIKK